MKRPASSRKRKSPAGSQKPLRQSSSSRKFTIVGIGASAGGLDAFTQLLKPLPTDTGMAFVLVQHLDPGHRSSLADILSRQTRLPVHEVRDQMAVEPNQVYVIPPNVQMTIRNGVLRLTPRGDAPGRFMPIDSFLRSLAEDQGSQAIAVILSGADADGTLALQAIKAEGGITFAQDPASAKIRAMPTYAAESGLVDFVLPPERIAYELIRMARDPAAVQFRSAPSEELFPKGQGEMAKIFFLLRQARGVDFTYYKQTTLKRRITRRMIVHKIDSLKEYVKFLKANPAEAGALYDDFLIHVTGFFRDPAIFENLKAKVIPRLLKMKSPQDPIRMWVPGCATGEEVYSIAICLLEFLGDKAQEIRIQLFATDISETALQKARAGIYTEQALLQVSPARRRRFFTPVSGGYQVAKFLQDFCLFAKHNVAQDPPFSKLDLISCRNVLIYLGPVLQKKTMAIFHYALKPSGVLLLGNSENLSLYSDLFTPLDGKHKVYSKKMVSIQHHPIFHAADYPVQKAGARLPPLVEGSLLNMRKEADQHVLSQRAPAGVIIDGALAVLEFRGPIGQYLDFVSGAASFNLLKLAKEGLLLELRAALFKAKKEKAPVTSKGSRMRREDGYANVTIEVLPLKQSPSHDPHYLVLFEETAPSPPPRNKPSRAARTPKDAILLAAELENTRLRKELIAAKDYLQSMINEQESINEELKSANEEALSSNEEFQSANEELETAKEELQATNEETSTLNEELRNRNLELTRANDDLMNVMSRASNPIVILGKDQHIRRMTPAAEKMLNMTRVDVGRSIHDLALGISLPQLEANLASVVDTLKAQDYEVQDGRGHWYLLRLEPYKTLDDKIDGVVMSFSDIQQAKDRQEVAAKWTLELETQVKQRTEELRHSQAALHQAEKLEAVGRLAGGVAHDFNNLMTGILGITENLQKRLGAKSAYRQDLEDVLSAARKANVITKQLLAFGQRQVVNPRIVNINDVITTMVGLFRRLLGEDIEVQTVLDPQLGSVYIDPGNLEQMILNLGLNARDAMRAGGKLILETVNVELGKEYAKQHFDVNPGAYVALTVSDTGSGMPREVIEHMFEPFFTTKGGGTGLGLANVYGIVKKARGDISVESEAGKGTVFKIFLPRVQASTVRRPPEETLGEALGGPETVLVVEDEEVVRKVAVRALKKKGYKILHARSAPEAIALSGKHAGPIHLLVTDVIMPGMNGRDLAAALTAKRPDMAVLYMSGHTRQIIGERGILESGMNFIEKTFRAETLCRKVREVLDQAPQEEVHGLKTRA